MERNNKTKIGFADIKERVAKIYGEKNKAMDKPFTETPEMIYTDFLAKSVEQVKFPVDEKFKENLLKSFLWVIAISNRFEEKYGDLSKIFLSHYPGKCPYCKNNVCTCIKGSKADRIYPDLYFVKENQNFLQIEKQIKMIGEIYPKNELSFSLGKLAEEIREFEIQVIREFAKINISNEKHKSSQEEMSDILARFYSIFYILKITNLEEELLKILESGCPVCTYEPCECRDLMEHVRHYTVGSKATG